MRLIEELLKKATNIFYVLESYPRLREGLKSFKSKNFDVILLDLTLPDSDKEYTLDRVISIATNIPVIILTGLDDKEFALNSLKKGAQDYLFKNELNEVILVRSILYAIERKGIKGEKETEKVKEVQLDEKDREILDVLQNNYNISYRDLSKKVKLAASTIHKRVQYMLEEGIIQKIDTIVDPFKVGFKSMAIVGLSVDPLKLDEVAKQLATYDKNQLVTTSTGEHNLILRIIAENEKKLWRFINEKIKTIDGVQPTIDVSGFIDIIKMSHKINFEKEKED